MLCVYLSSPVSYYQRDLNLRIANLFRSNGDRMLLPQEITKTKLKHRKFDLYVYEKCIEMIQESNLGLLVYPYGRDCAWEAGYYEGLNKPMFAFIEEYNSETINRLRDWMIKGALDEVITSDLKFYKELEKDLIINSQKIHFLDKFEDLQQLITKLYRKYENCNSCLAGAGALIVNENKILLVKEKHDASTYLRRKGMWGYPTTTIHSKSPEEQAIISAKKEVKADVNNPRFISQKSIQNAVGLFYEVNMESTITENSNLKWFSFDEILEDEKLYMRPTYREVLTDWLKLHR